MAQQTSPFLEGKYGWDYGESGWNSGMDENINKFSFMFDRNVDSITASLPPAVNGQSHYLTTDNRIYFAVGTTYYSTPVPKHFILTVRATGQTHQFNGTSLVQIDSPTQLDSRLDAVEVVVSSLGTAAFEDVTNLATQSELDVVSAQANSYTDTLRSDLSATTGASEVGYLGHSVQERLSRVVYVEDAPFGAVGDGVADDSDAIELAINSGARVVKFGNLNYKITRPINLYTSDVEIDLAGASLVQASINTFGLRIGRALNGNFVKVEDVCIHGGKFIGSDDGQGSDYSSGITIQAPLTDPYVKYGGCNRIRIHGMLFSGWAISIAATATTDLRVHGNTSQDTFFHAPLVAGGYGILLQTCFDTFITDNHFISVTKSSPTTTTDRHAIYVSANPIRPFDSNNVCKGVLISGNTVSWDNVHNVTGFELGINIRGAFDVRVIGNTITGGYGALSYVVDNAPGQNISIIGNTFRNTQTNGTNSQGCIFVQRTTGSYIARNVTISANTCDINGVGGFGIGINSADAVSISGNTIYSSTTIGYGIHVSGSCSNVSILPNSMKLYEAYALAFSGSGNSDIMVSKQQVTFSSVTGIRLKFRTFTVPTGLRFSYQRTFSIVSNGAGTISSGVGEDFQFISSVASDAFGVTVTFDGTVDVSALGITCIAHTSTLGSIYKRGTGTNTITFGVTDRAGNSLPAATNAYTFSVAIPH